MIATRGGVGVSEDAAALVGARSREENEAWAMTIVPVAHFGSGMIQTEARWRRFAPRWPLGVPAPSSLQLP